MLISSKKNPALQIISAILLAITLSLSILSVGLWWTLLRGGAAGDISRSAVADPQVQRGLAIELLNKFAEGADPQTATLIEEKRADLELTLDKVLADPATAEKISAIANSVADALASDRGGTIGVSTAAAPAARSVADRRHHRAAAARLADRVAGGTGAGASGHTAGGFRCPGGERASYAEVVTTRSGYAATRS